MYKLYYYKVSLISIQYLLLRQRVTDLYILTHKFRVYISKIESPEMIVGMFED